MIGIWLLVVGDWRFALDREDALSSQQMHRVGRAGGDTMNA